MRSLLLVAVVATAMMACATEAFVPTVNGAKKKKATTSYNSMKRTSFVTPQMAAVRKTALKMATEEEIKAAQAAAAAEQGKEVFDDEVAPYKPGISDSMKERLMREASTGLDSEQKQTNVLLYICIGVAALVALGGSGILY